MWLIHCVPGTRLFCVCVGRGRGEGEGTGLFCVFFFTQNIYFYCGNIYITNFTFLPIFKFSGIKDR